MECLLPRELAREYHDRSKRQHQVTESS